MREIELSRGTTALVDDEDFERISLHSWALNPQGNYAVRKGNRRRGEPRTVQMHREVLNPASGVQVDHINGNTLDNRKENLRLVDTQKNAFNRAKPNVPCTSVYKGVFRRKNKPNWQARIKYNDKHIELGTYVKESYAAAVYNFAAAIFFGEYRRENVGAEIPSLADADKLAVYRKCKRAIQKHGWYVDTEAYRSFHFKEAV
ncbi:MAG: HNH endonuclease [Clostridium sp.]|nr:HNH endonuclease [Clostridium sp.]